MNLRTTWFIITAFLALSAANAQATLIDQFVDGDQWLFVSYRTGQRSDADKKTGILSAIDGCRDIWLEWKSGAMSTAEVVASNDDGVDTGFYFTQGEGPLWRRSSGTETLRIPQAHATIPSVQTWNLAEKTNSSWTSAR